MIGILIIFLLGLILGSFLNVCIYRLPRGKAVAWDRSRCPGCCHPLSWLDLIPVISYLALGGRCRYCQVPIGVWHPVVELVTGVLATVLWLRFGVNGMGPAVVAVAVALVATGTDLKEGVISDRLTLPALVVGLGYSFFSPLTDPVASLSGVLIGGGLFLVTALLSGGGMGGGDIKLMAAMGAWVGWRLTLGTMVVAFVTGGVVAIILLLLGKKRRGDALPFAPFLAAGLVITLLWGQELYLWYVQGVLRL